jgi:opacity protein-like surface antigen
MKKLLTGIFMLAGASLASAENSDTNGFSYDYVEGAYSWIKFSDTSDEGSALSADFSAYQLKASKAITSNVILDIGYSYAKSDSLTVDGTSYDFDVTGHLYGLGIGYRFAVGDGTDLNLRVGYSQNKLKATYEGATVDETNDTTYPISIGIRQKITPTVEFQGTYIREDGENDYYLGIGFEVTKQVNLFGAINPNTFGDAYIIGVRYNY